MCAFLSVAGPDYIKQQFKEPVEIKEVPVEKKDKSPKDSPHFYRKGTTPPHSPVTSPVATPPPSPHSDKKKSQTTNSNGSRKTIKDEKPLRKTSKEEKISHKNSKEERLNRKPSKEERVLVNDSLKGPPAHIEAPAKPAKLQPSAATTLSTSHLPTLPVNGELHSEYHSYYVKAPTRVPPPPDPEEDVEEEPSALALARMPPQPLKPLGTPTPKPPFIPESKSEQKLRKQDSLKPKSLADAKKASMEIVEPTEERVSSDSATPGSLLLQTISLIWPYSFPQILLRENLWHCITPNLLLSLSQGPNSILVAMVMLLNIGLAIIFVHFLTWWWCLPGKFTCCLGFWSLQQRIARDIIWPPMMSQKITFRWSVSSLLTAFWTKLTCALFCSETVVTGSVITGLENWKRRSETWGEALSV